jgi:hypothetical protein
MWLALTVAAYFALTTRSAPIPASGPDSKGPISDALRVRGKMPATTAPQPTKVVMVDDTLEVSRWVTRSEAVEQTRKVVVDGKEVEERYVTVRMVPVAMAMRVVAKECKFFTVVKEGKLEALDVKKAAAMLKKPTAVVTGDSAEVDPRVLEVVKPGTLYLMLPTPRAMPVPGKGPDKLLPGVGPKTEPSEPKPTKPVADRPSSGR